MNRTERENLSKDLLAYGTFKADYETVEKDGFRRIRIIECDGKIYLHHMFNGELVDCYEI